MEYETLSNAEKLSLAREALRGKEADHFRLSLGSAVYAGGQENIDRLADDIESIKERILELVAEDENQGTIKTPATSDAASQEDAAKE